MKNQAPVLAPAFGADTAFVSPRLREFAACLSQRFSMLQPVSADDRIAVFTGRDASGRAVEVRALLTEEPMERDLFFMQAEAAAQLNHEHIARASAVEQIDGVRFYVVELPEKARTLRQLINRIGWLPEEAAIAIGMQLASALDYAHRAGITHLGIAPETVWIDADGTARLAGFGIPMHPEASWARQERSARANLRYHSPEQAAGARVDERSDLYALGLLLYEMLTDRVPFDGENDHTAQRKRLTQLPMPPALLRDDLSHEMSRLVMALLARDPEERLPSADALQAALARMQRMHARPDVKAPATMTTTAKPPAPPIEQPIEQPAPQPLSVKAEPPAQEAHREAKQEAHREVHQEAKPVAAPASEPESRERAIESPAQQSLSQQPQVQQPPVQASAAAFESFESSDERPARRWRWRYVLLAGALALLALGVAANFDRLSQLFRGTPAAAAETQREAPPPESILITPAGAAGATAAAAAVNNSANPPPRATEEKKAGVQKSTVKRRPASRNKRNLNRRRVRR